ncbi:MAG: hypothetical protein A3B74_02710 [Candidatus Kerfeldbacteria bacterium RIFCSPHIGHO2_02_FULL_42_14]|uniref:Aspartyl/glutamyl-tRNA(Asn/Gln) amidotransferase subunit C n=1 Tax=Candidatus Kerfeldbacteria bacterium RIFCSPHIGHO2_02_FULL_42_14 TaxID=1798540 RepID=A0A1G2ASZ9_9BACT|nr:MAG: hypothetical protein A3B74_02710 [Candidatus Kerfeldbacteria bacterium RIFCSPHIGHO2_02_FULL_42_14]OGY83881.1 MAG: hypothetical protein A3I91_04855 [Candidatus Kerfeldbacteria bacterium RIFCSPLOWO2_02_FULL_42_19]OGY86580.1 MAG: hypothetical protein A3G01_04975 [Candidatus Kerfeldbacteria bacterium RIFCSPLOWO2_12_FULL_43_9]
MKKHFKRCYNRLVSEWSLRHEIAYKYNMKLEKQLIQHLAQLSRITMDAYEQELITKDLSRIIAHVDTLRSVKTQTVEPTHQVTNLSNITRDDLVTEKHERDHILKSVPSQEGGYIKIQKVL